MSVFLTLPDSVGVAPTHIVKDGVEIENPRAGELEPLSSIGVPMALPVMAGGEVVESSTTYTIEPAEKLAAGQLARIVPGTRTVEVDHAGLVNVLVGQAGYVEGKAPKSTPSSKTSEVTQ